VNSTVVDQLRSVVEDSRVFSHLEGAGVTEQWAWLCLHSGVTAFVAAALAVALRRVKLYYQPGEYEGGPSERSLRETHWWRCLLWTVALPLLLLTSVYVVCDAVTLYQYVNYPKAMVLRDILKRI
jgi:hypothetical protein